MKSLFAVTMIACAICFVSFIPSNPLHVDGKLVVHGHGKRACTFEVVVKGDDKVVANAKLDTSGHFKLSFTPAGEKYFDFFYIDSHHAADTIFLRSYTEFESDQLEETFYTYKGIVRVDEDDHVICPKCKKSDNVSAIEGLPGYYYCADDRIKF